MCPSPQSQDQHPSIVLDPVCCPSFLKRAAKHGVGAFGSKVDWPAAASVSTIPRHRTTSELLVQRGSSRPIVVRVPLTGRQTVGSQLTCFASLSDSEHLL